MPDRDQARGYLERLALDLRAKAEQYRTHAEGIRNKAAKDTLLGLAADSDRMAANAEDRAKALGDPASQLSSAPDPSASKPT